MEWLSLLVGGAGVLGFLGTLLTLRSTRSKNRAEVAKLIAETEKIRIEAIHDLQHQLDEIRAQNQELFEKREQERLEKERLRAELNRLHFDIESLRNELHVERTRNTQLVTELYLQRVANVEKVNTIEELQAVVAEQGDKLKAVDADMQGMKKVTGSLHLPARDDPKEATP